MSTKAEWVALAERCEKATEADREVDVSIGLALDWQTDGTRPLREVVSCYDSVAEFVERACSAYTSIYNRDEHMPRWTASLDAITSLIERELPAAWAWTLGQNIHHRTWGVSINNLDDGGAPYSVCWGQSSRTPALALCAAFCRAMSERAAAQPVQLGPQVQDGLSSSPTPRAS